MTLQEFVLAQWPKEGRRLLALQRRRERLSEGERKEADTLNSFINEGIFSAARAGKITLSGVRDGVREKIPFPLNN